MPSPARSRPLPPRPADPDLVRARFEIVRRDAEIDCLRRRLAALEPPGGHRDALGTQRLRLVLERLDEECAFVTDLLEGGGATREDLERVRTIAHRPWRDAAGAQRPLLSDDEIAGLDPA